MNELKKVARVVRYAFVHVGLMCVPSVIYAADNICNSTSNNSGNSSTYFINPVKYPDLQCLLLGILEAVVMILFPIVILMIVYTGFLFVAAQGNPAKLQEARRALLWTVIGGLIVLGAEALAMAIAETVANIQQNA